MTTGLMFFLLFIPRIFNEGSTDLVQTDQTVVSEFGGEAHLHCQLTRTKDVRQVTWQKILPDVDKNVATYSDAFGENVNRDFKDKVKFKDAGLQSCSIVIMEVTEQDEGCYLCLFNTYPDGALTGKTCLRVYELHEAVLHVRESNSPEESVVSCSATGRPAPTVTLSVTQADVHFSDNNTVSVTNTNRTVTVNATAVISGLRGNRVQVTCTVRVLSVQKDVFMMIPEVKPTSADAFRADNKDFDSTWIIVSLVVCVCLIVFLFVLFKQRHKISSCQNDSEMIKTPQRKTTDVDKNKTPLMVEVNELLRSCSSKKKRPNFNRINESLLTPTRDTNGNKTPLMEKVNEQLRSCSSRKKRPNFNRINESLLTPTRDTNGNKTPEVMKENEPTSCLRRRSTVKKKSPNVRTEESRSVSKKLF